MAHISTLTNRTRAAQRPPFSTPKISAERLARLLNLPRKPAGPVVKPQNPQPKRARDEGKKPNASGQPLQPSQPARPPQAGGSPRQVENKPPASPAAGPSPGTMPAQPHTSKTNGGQLPASPFLHGRRNAHQPASQSSLYNPLILPSRSPRQPTRTPPPPKPESPILQEPLIEDEVRQQKTAAPPPADTAPLPVTLPAAPAWQEKPALPPAQAVTLEQIYTRHADLPVKSAILGVGEDGLPVLFDLADPAPGAIAVIGDERGAQMDLLRTAVASLAGRNSPRSVQVLIISHQPQVWKTWVSERGYDRFCLDVLGGDSPKVHEWVLRLADWTEQRRLGQRSGPPVLVVMDTLSFLARLPQDVRLNFVWMLKEAPAAQIWPLAALSTDLARTLDSSVFAAFQTRLLGYSRNPQVYIPLTGMEMVEAENFRQPGQFSVLVGQHWLRFRPLAW